MSTPAITPRQPSDPYAEFGGQSTGQSGTAPTVPVSTQPVGSDPYAEFGGVAVKPTNASDTNQLTPSLGQRALTVGSDLLQGVGEGALQTVHGTGELIRKGGNLLHPGLGNAIVPPSGQQALQQVATPENLTQSVGLGAESVAEAVLGDEALKGLSLGDKLLHAGKVGEYYEKASPFVRRLIEHGMTYGRAGAAAGTETAVKTGDVGEGVKAGAEAAATAGLLSAAGSGVQRVWNSATGKTIQQELQTGIRSVLKNVDAAESPSIRNSASAVADSVESKSKGLYQQIDNATSGEFTNIQQKIKNVDTKLRDIAGTDDTLEEKLFNQKVALKVKLDEAIDAAVKNGVDPSVADDARNTWKQASALRDLDTQIKASTYGNVKNAPEIVDPRKLVTRLQKLEDSGRLTEAIGDHADNLMQQAYDSAKSAQRLATVKKIATGTAIGGAIAGGAKLTHIFSPETGLTPVQ